MKLYITGPKDNGEGVYYILTQDGDCLASHLCSHAEFAREDLEGRRVERQKEWKEKFGEYQVLWIGDDDMTEEKLIKLNQDLYEAQKNQNETAN